MNSANEMRAKALEAKQQNAIKRRKRVKALFAAEPHLSDAKAAERLGVHSNTIRNDRKALGIVKRK